MPRFRTTRRFYRADIQRLTARGMGESRNVRCSRCESRVSLPYWMRTPTTVRITNPPMPGRATAASAHIEVISRSSSKRSGKNDSVPIGKALLGACGAIPDRADARPSKITSSVVATVAALPPTGTPETPAKGRTSGARDTPDPPAAAASPAPWMSPDPSSSGATPAMRVPAHRVARCQRAHPAPGPSSTPSARCNGQKPRSERFRRRLESWQGMRGAPIVQTGSAGSIPFDRSSS
jgi:hypothetical protein